MDVKIKGGELFDALREYIQICQKAADFLGELVGSGAVSKLEKRSLKGHFAEREQEQWLSRLWQYRTLCQKNRRPDTEGRDPRPGLLILEGLEELEQARKLVHDLQYVVSRYEPHEWFLTERQTRLWAEVLDALSDSKG